MRYSLWSGDRLVGHTDLDIDTVTPTMRQGFIEPTPEGRPLLEDATGVWRAMADRKRAERAREGDETTEGDDMVTASMNRRESLNLELRDEHGVVFECDFMRVYDLFDLNAGVVDDMSDTEEEQQADFEIYLSSLSPEHGADALAERAATYAEVEALVAEVPGAQGERTCRLGLAAAARRSAMGDDAVPAPGPSERLLRLTSLKAFPCSARRATL